MIIRLFKGILKQLKKRSDIFRRRSVAVIIQAESLKSAMILWITREMLNME